MGLQICGPKPDTFYNGNVHYKNLMEGVGCTLLLWCLCVRACMCVRVCMPAACMCIYYMSNGNQMKTSVFDLDRIGHDDILVNTRGITCTIQNLWKKIFHELIILLLHLSL